MQMRRIAGVVAVVAMGGALVALAGCGSAANVASAAAAPAGPVVQQHLEIVTGRMLGKPGWPQYQPAAWTAQAGDTVVLTIVSHDDGTAPLPAGSPYAQVQGTATGTELVNGKPVSSIPVDQVAHTFTVPALGINLAIPVAPKGGTITVQATIHFAKAGVYYWHCNAPCGTGANGLGGPMAAPGWMEGTITVQGA
jgi:plastocyanin